MGLVDDVLTQLNRARTNPKEFAEQELKPKLALFNGNRFEKPGEVTLVTSEGAAAVEDAIAQLASTEPMQTLLLSEGLCKAAQDHVNDHGPGGKTGHTGTDGSSPFDRMGRYGSWQNSASENCSYGCNTGVDIVAQLITDDGVASRGHRKNILNPESRFVGIACGPHKEYRYMCVQDFAVGYTEGGGSGAPPPGSAAAAAAAGVGGDVGGKPQPAVIPVIKEGTTVVEAQGGNGVPPDVQAIIDEDLAHHPPYAKKVTDALAEPGKTVQLIRDPNKLTIKISGNGGSSTMTLSWA